MIVSILIYTIAVLSLLQRTDQRLYAALVYSFFTVTHEMFLNNLDGIWYYGSAGLFDLFIICYLSRPYSIPKLTTRLIHLSIASIMINFIGWIAWMLYFPPYFYNTAFMLIYILAIAALLTGDRMNDGGVSLDRWLHWVRASHHQGTSHSRRSHKKI